MFFETEREHMPQRNAHRMVHRLWMAGGMPGQHLLLRCWGWRHRPCTSICRNGPSGASSSKVMAGGLRCPTRKKETDQRQRQGWQPGEFARAQEDIWRTNVLCSFATLYRPFRGLSGGHPWSQNRRTSEGESRQSA